jgi:Calcineurin-like phosphoesterase
MASMAISSTQWAVALVIVLVALWLGSHDLASHNNNNKKASSIADPTSNDDVDSARTPDNERDSNRRATAATTTTTGSSSPSVLTIYAIGDLHGDVECARQWVARTNVLRRSDEAAAAATTTDDGETPLVWRDDTTRLVFLGDYVDKGITAKQTVEYVKYLTETYPDYVTAIMGNHELELLRDRTETVWGHGNAGYYQVSVHCTPKQ